MRCNVKSCSPCPAIEANAYQQLRRSVLACLLWEDEFYEDGVSVAGRIGALSAVASRDQVANLAYEARTKFNLRHVPLLLLANLAYQKRLNWRDVVPVIQRADEIPELLSIYAKLNGRAGQSIGKLSNALKRGLAESFGKFDEYQLAKYNREGDITLRDAMFLTHPKGTETLSRLANGTLETPDTWEVALSAASDKRSEWERLLDEGKLGALALLRNLRNMKQAGVDDRVIREALANCKTDRVLPFRFISAARAVPELSDALESLMLRNLEGAEKLSGHTVLLVDNSGSMYGATVSARSDLTRSDAACALAILAREVCERCTVYSFSDYPLIVPPRAGFALADAIKKTSRPGGTNISLAVANAISTRPIPDRVILITDEQSQTRVQAVPRGVRGYVLNVASYQNGISYGSWLHVDGWSESVINFIREVERN